MSVCVSTCLCVTVAVYLYMYVCVCLHVCVSLLLCTSICICVCVYMSVCTVAEYLYMSVCVCTQELEQIEMVWVLTSEWDDHWNTWKSGRFIDVETGDMEEISTTLFRKLQKMSRELKVSCC